MSQKYQRICDTLTDLNSAVAMHREQTGALLSKNEQLTRQTEILAEEAKMWRQKDEAMQSSISKIE
jgi:hypothetical protein